ncbi:Telomere repeat-binding protein 4 [Linum grandiflorum]
METEVGVEGNGGEGKLFEESEVEKLCSSLASPHHIADPIVYKLVRVEGDGRFVPATDDEVMEVADLFLDDTIDTGFLDIEQVLGCTSGDGMHQLDSTGGLLQAENQDFHLDGIHVQPQETVSEFAPSICETRMMGCESVRDFPGSLETFSEDVPLTSLADPFMPDFSKVKGEICLDDLSIKELQETFRATFGRETSVKDKQWLKRRIAMGLTNSCDVSASSFTIRDNKLVDNGVSSNNMVAVIGSDQLPEASTSNERQLPSTQSSEQKDEQVVSDERLREGSICDNHRDVDDHTEERAAKRVRRPTKRYIEELSETESKEAFGRLMDVDPNSRPGQPSPNCDNAHARNASLGGRTLIIRLDSLGGYEIQIPCVSRVRRSRPRKDFMTLLKFSSIDVTTTVVQKAFAAHIARPHDENVNMVTKPQSIPKRPQPLLVDVMNKEKQQLTATGAHRKEPKPEDFSSGDSDGNLTTVPTPKGGFRRKHHRAWALSEVIKLVDGVSMYGAGRWSEIKRLSFASSPFRTSVDLKDKWRNLLKASFAHAPPDKGASMRKNATSTPIPETILSRVRELAEKQSLVRPGSSNKAAGTGNSHVPEKQTGYL